MLYGDIEKASTGWPTGYRARLPWNSHIALVLPNSVDFAVADFGIYTSGAALVPMNMMISPVDVAFNLRDAQARMVFVDVSLAEKVLAMRSDLPDLKEIVVVGGDSSDGLIGWEDFKAKYPDTVVSPTAQEDDDALIIYTGGTTGKRGVVRSTGLFFDILAHGSSCRSSPTTRCSS